MANRDRYTATQFISAIESSFGIKTAIASTLECDRHTVDSYIERYPTIRRAYEAERNRLVDMAEGKFAEAISKGEWAAISFALRTLGKDRGFVESRALDVTSGGEKIPTAIIYLPEVDGEVDGLEAESGTAGEVPS